MRTILHAIVETAACADGNKKGLDTLRGVNHVEPGDNWPRHEPITIAGEGIKVIAQLLKRVDKILDERHRESPVKGLIETWCDALDGDNKPINPRQVLRIDVPCAGDGVVVPLVSHPYFDITGVMRPRKVRLGTPPGLLSSGYVDAAQTSVGYFGAPLWYTDGKMALLFNPVGQERHLDFALVMPVSPPDIEGERYPWGRPTAEQEAVESSAPAPDSLVPELEDDEELPRLGPDLAGEDTEELPKEPPQESPKAVDVF